MEYKANLIPLNKIPDSKMMENGTLCDQCCSFDCSNPIVNLTVSVIGVNKRMKVWKTNTNRFAVVNCEGFRKDSAYSENENEDEV